MYLQLAWHISAAVSSWFGFLLALCIAWASTTYPVSAGAFKQADLSRPLNAPIGMTYTCCLCEKYTSHVHGFLVKRSTKIEYMIGGWSLQCLYLVKVYAAIFLEVQSRKCAINSLRIIMSGGCLGKGLGAHIKLFLLGSPLYFQLI